MHAGGLVAPSGGPRRLLESHLWWIQLKGKGSHSAYIILSLWRGGSIARVQVFVGWAFGTLSVCILVVVRYCLAVLVFMVAVWGPGVRIPNARTCFCWYTRCMGGSMYHRFLRDASMSWTAAYRTLVYQVVVLPRYPLCKVVGLLLPLLVCCRGPVARAAVCA